MDKDTPGWLGLEREWFYEVGTVEGRKRSLLETQDQTRALRALATGPTLYAVQFEGGVIKIGCSHNFAQRYAAHRAAGAVILAFVPGDYADEQAIHQRLVLHLKRGWEWYYPTSEVLAEVNEMRNHFQLPHLVA